VKGACVAKLISATLADQERRCPYPQPFYISMSLDGFVAGPNEGPGNGLGDGGTAC
jgi:hypothetical protein